MSYYIELNAQQAEALISEQKPMILDVRDFVSYKEQHIEGAMHSHGDLVEHLIARQQFERPVLVYCYHGNSSKDLAEFFGGIGFKTVYSMAGGYTAWKKLETA